MKTPQDETNKILTCVIQIDCKTLEMHDKIKTFDLGNYFLNKGSKGRPGYNIFGNSVDLDQLASVKPADQDPHCFLLP